MGKVIYRVYDTYITCDSMLYSDSREVAEHFCSKLNKKDALSSYRVEEILINEPVWEDNLDCMPEK